MCKLDCSYPDWRLVLLIFVSLPSIPASFLPKFTEDVGLARKSAQARSCVCSQFVMFSDYVLLHCRNRRHVAIRRAPSYALMHHNASNWHPGYAPIPVYASSLPGSRVKSRVMPD